MLLVDEPLRQRSSFAHPVLEERPPADRMAGGKFEIGKSEAHEVDCGFFCRTIGACQPDCSERGVEHRQGPQSDTKDEFVEVLEDVIDRSDGAAGLAR
jgi:hypothetical protein